MSIFSSYKKIFLLGFITVILVAIPFSVYIAQKRQQTITKAAQSTVLSLEPATTPVKVGDTVTLSVMLDPAGTGNSPNQVDFVKLSLTYDSTKFSTISGSLQVNSSDNALTTTVDPLTYESGKASISLSIGADPTAAIIRKTKIATFQLQATNATTSTASSIGFGSDSQVLSIGDKDGTGENVLSTTNPATVTITGFSTTTTPTAPPASAPSCTSLNVDRATTGTVPYAITFTAAGNTSNGTISKVSFNFGDGSVQDLTTGTGIGTNSVSNAQTTHTYNTAGTYTAYAILTGNNSTLSTQQNNCSQTITVNSVGSTGGGTMLNPTVTPTATVTPIATVTPTLTPSPIPSIVLPPTGPGEKILNVGILGAIFTIIGGALFIL